MGFDKQLFHVCEDRLFAEVIQTLTRRFNDVMVVTKYPEMYRGMGVRSVPDIIPGFGPMSGIHAAAREAESEYVYIIACDMPNVDLNYVDYMIQKITDSSSDACVTEKGGWIEPFHAFYGKRALPAMESDLNEGKGSIYYMLQKINTFYIPEAEARRFTPDWSLFCNLNTPEEYNSLAAGSIYKADTPLPAKYSP